MGKSVVDVTAIVQHGPILVCFKIQTGGGTDLGAAAETATEAIIVMIEAIPVD